jgi:hypothetical protein
LYRDCGGDERVCAAKLQKDQKMGKKVREETREKRAKKIEFWLKRSEWE